MPYRSGSARAGPGSSPHRVLPVKAVLLTRYGSPEDLEVRDVPRPEPGPGQVLIRVAASSVNDWDASLASGKPFYVRALCGLRAPRVRIPGVDVAGTVEAAGERVTRWQPGDRVFGDLSGCGFGAFAEHVCAPQDAVAAAPETLSLEQAAALPHAAALAYQALFDVAGLRPEHRLLVNGAGGGVGTLAVQMARDLGVRDVVGVDHGDKHVRMRAAGYADCLDHRLVDFTRTGERHDVVLDARTTRAAHAYLRALRPGGTYVTVGGHTDKLLQVGLLGPLLGRASGRRLRVLGLKPSGGLDAVRALCDAGRLAPVLDSTVPLAQVPAALRRFGDGLHTGKIVIAVGAG